MVKWLQRQDDELARRLRAQAEAARITPSPELRRRTLSALQAVVRDTPSPRRQGRLAAYALACGLVVLLAASTAVLHRPQPQPARDVPIGFLFGPQHIELESPWETLLLDEAHHMADDAREVGEYLLASLPLPSLAAVR